MMSPSTVAMCAWSLQATSGTCGLGVYKGLQKPWRKPWCIVSDTIIFSPRESAPEVFGKVKEHNFAPRLKCNNLQYNVVLHAQIAFQMSSFRKYDSCLLGSVISKVYPIVQNYKTWFWRKNPKPVAPRKLCSSFILKEHAKKLKNISWGQRCQSRSFTFLLLQFFLGPFTGAACCALLLRRRCDLAASFVQLYCGLIHWLHALFLLACLHCNRDSLTYRWRSTRRCA